MGVGVGEVAGGNMSEDFFAAFFGKSRGKTVDENIARAFRVTWRFWLWRIYWIKRGWEWGWLGQGWNVLRLGKVRVRL